jgi:hypothetical protein
VRSDVGSFENGVVAITSVFIGVGHIVIGDALAEVRGHGVEIAIARGDEAEKFGRGRQLGKANGDIGGVNLCIQRPHGDVEGT